MAVPERFKVGITRYGPDDAGDLAAWRQRAGISMVPARYAWLERNPGHGEDGPGPWICRRDRRIVGQQGEIPFDLQVAGERRRAVWAMGLNVEPAWRMRGVGPALIATLLDHNPLVCVLNVSADGYPAFLRSGCADLGAMAVYRRPLDARRALRLPRVPAGLRRLAPVLAPLWGLADRAAAAATWLAGARLVPVDRFDEQADEVWARVAGSSAAGGWPAPPGPSTTAAAYRVLARRDLAALAWRIDQRPDRDRLRRYYLVRRGRAIGYVVLRPTSSADEPTVVVVDYLAPSRWVAPLLLAAGRAARRDGAVAMNLKTRNVPARRWLRAAGFVRRFQGGDGPIQLMVRCADDPDVCSQIHDPDAWFLTAADSDIEFAVPSDDTDG